MKALRFAVLGAVLCVTACGVLPKKKNDMVPKATLPTWIGQVVMVDTTHRFALVDTGGSNLLVPGTRMIAFRESNKTAGLQTTAENAPPFLAVEITEGMPAMGDKVALDEGRPLVTAREEPVDEPEISVVPEKESEKKTGQGSRVGNFISRIFGKKVRGQDF